ncbi:hypothetical protein HUJ04_008515 [Dendroctonus ponderosae]|nr:hypothetical protein HUJ04_008515 [Dendroctonus ponderosae]
MSHEQTQLSVLLEYQTMHDFASMRLKCSNCPRNYKHRQQFVRHLRYECGKTPTVSCPYCPIKFYHKFRLKPHTRRVHGIEFEG